MFTSSLKNNILLINPPKELGKVYSKVGQECPPVNLIVIATVLKKNGHNVRIFDFEVNALSELEEMIRRDKFDYIGITSYTSSFNAIIELIGKIKKLSEAKIVLGGPHPTALPEECQKFCDHAVVGDGEDAFLYLMEHPEEKIIKVVTKDINFVPDYSFVNMAKYGRGWAYSIQSPSYPVYTARGCPMNCKFCQRVTMYRNVDLDVVFENIRMLIEKYGMKQMMVLDGTFAVNKERTLEFCRRIREEFPKLKWDCMARTDMLDEEEIKALARGNCVSVGVGIETAKEDLRKFMGKNDSIMHMKNIMGLLRKHGVESRGYYILANPEEKKEDVLKTIKLARFLNPDYSQFTIFTPLPGSFYFERFKNEGRITTYDWSKYTTFDSVYSHEYLSFEEIKDLLKKANREIYFNPRFIVRQFIKLIKNPSRLSTYLRGLKGVLAASN